MFELFENFIHILSELLPDKNQPFRVWASKILLLVFAGVGTLVLVFLLIKDTPYGQKNGFSAPPPQKVILPTGTEFAYTYRFVSKELSKFRDKDSEVSGIFLVSIFNKIINDFDPNRTDDNSDLLIWASDLQSIRTDSDLENLDYLLNREKALVFDSNITDTTSNKKRCIVGATPYSLAMSLTGILKTKNVNYYSLCGIPDRSGNFTIALTVTFFYAKTPQDANLISYNQQQTTIEIGRVFSRYTAGYVVKQLESPSH